MGERGQKIPVEDKNCPITPDCPWLDRQDGKTLTIDLKGRLLVSKIRLIENSPNKVFLLAYVLVSPLDQ